MRGAALTAAVVVALVATPAVAQAPNPYVRGFDTIPQKATPLSRSAFVVEGARAAPPGSWHGELLFDWDVQILAYLDGEPEGRATSSPGGSTGISWAPGRCSRSSSSAATSRSPSARGRTSRQIAGAFGPPVDTPVGAGLGDIRFVPRLFTPASWKLPVDVAFVPELRFPTGNATSFLGGNGFIFAPRIDVETRSGRSGSSSTSG